jgi:hypothetical protein
MACGLVEPLRLEVHPEGPHEEVSTVPPQAMRTESESSKFWSLTFYFIDQRVVITSLKRGFPMQYFIEDTANSINITFKIN